ncbi:MAG: M17 family metallopeptidase [Candidatus Rariloculaceae bacterium]
MSDLPELLRLKVSQSPQRATRQTLNSVEHAIFVVPEKPSGQVLRSLPHSPQLKKLLNRSASPIVASRLPNDNATGLTLAVLKADSTFERLSWARRVIAGCLRDNPRSIGIVAAGLDDDTRTAAFTSLVAAAEAAAFALPSFKSKNAARSGLSSIKLLNCKARLDLRTTRAESLGNNIARWFSAMPPNELDASSYRQAVQEIAKRHGIEYEFLNERKLKTLGAGAFLAVSQGNASRDAGVIRLRYRPVGSETAAVGLVGKGILFDTGGTNLKPFKSMLDMHMDMQGSAVALGTIVALATLEVPYAVDAWLAVTENRISATAYKSQDIIRAANGTTIQVIHTDAEGRMVLADTLAIAAREKPAIMIDYATLTGTCVSALTERYSGIFSNRPAANKLLRNAGMASGERVWPFPMDADFDELLASDVADIKQCSTAGLGDHILAARFLSKFVPEDIPWVHVDLSAGQSKGGLGHIPSEVTGFGVKLTLELLREQTPAAIAETLKA